jgi:hypothetical protein
VTAYGDPLGSGKVNVKGPEPEKSSVVPLLASCTLSSSKRPVMVPPTVKVDVAESPLETAPVSVVVESTVDPSLAPSLASGADESTARPVSTTAESCGGSALSAGALSAGALSEGLLSGRPSSSIPPSAVESALVESGGPPSGTAVS